MKKFFVMLALAWGTVGAFAQNEADSVAAVNNAVTLAKEVYPQKEEDGDLYHGLTRKLTFDRMIPPYGLEVTYGKTTHIIFPSSVRYVDLGSPNLIAGKADGAENVIRVKTTVKDFREETNMSVITESGSFYTFNVKYAEEPLLLNIEMKDFIHDGSEVNRPNNALDIYLKELGCESPKLVHLISKSIHKDNRRHIKHIGSKAFGIQYLLRGLYTHNGLLYFHTQIKNRSNVPYEVDFVTFKIVDKKLMKRTAIQEQVIFPLRAYDYVTSVAGKKDGRTVFVFDKFTIPSDKVLMVEMHEKGCLALTIPSLLLLGFGHNFPMIIGGGLCFGIGYGIFDANNMPILCQFISPRYRATAYGIMNMTGVFAGAAITDILGKSTDAGNLGHDFAMLAGLVLIALLIQVIFLRPKVANMTDEC